MYTVNTFAEAYAHILETVYNNPDYITSPRGMKIKEIMNYAITINDPFSNLFTNEVRSPDKKYLAGELLWYFSQSRDVNFINKYSKFWNKIANTDGTCNSAYGYLIFKENSLKNAFDNYHNGWNWVYNSLVKDRDSRQAIMHFNKPWHSSKADTKDFPCTIYGNFHIRNNALNFTIHMRSSDSIFGTTYDIPFFMLLHQQMWKLLKENEYNDLEIGTFTYMSNSQHIYEKDFELVDNMLKYDFVVDALPKIGENLVDVKYEQPIFNKVDNSLTNISIKNDNISELYYSVLNNDIFIKPITDDKFINWVLENL